MFNHHKKLSRFSYSGFLDSLKSVYFITGVLIALSYWIIDPFVDAVFLQVGTIKHRLFHPDAHEAYMRSVISAVIIIFSFICSVLLNRSKQVEEALQNSEERFRALYDNNPDILFSIDEYGMVLSVNQFGIDQLGYAKDQFVGQPVINVFYEEDRSLAKEYLNQCFSEPSKAHDWELRKIHQDGTVIYVHESVRVVDNVDGKPTALIVCEDITARKQVEEALIESENKYRTLFEQSADAILIFEGDKFVDCNSATVKMLGYKNKKELLETHPSALSPQMQPDGRNSLEKANEMISIAFDQGSHRFEWGHQRQNGEVFPVEVLLTPVPFGERNFLHAVWRDITERKQAEEALNESENKYRTLFEQSADAILIIEGDKFVDCNLATAKMLGYKNKKELLETHPSALSPEFQPDGSNSLEKANEILSTIFDQESIRFEWDHKRQNGEVFPVEVLLTPVPYGERKFIHCVWRDITERKQTEGELQKLSRAVESSSSAVYITNLEADIEYVNPKFTEITGYAREDVIGQNPRLLQSGETPKAVYADLWDTITSGGEWKGEFYNRKKNGCIYRARNSISGIRNNEGEITHYVAITDDVTHEYELSEQLSYQASHDALTGLINRFEFERRAERLLSTVRHDKGEHALCYLDLDQFKVINDTCGHTAGDELLRQLSSLLIETVRHRDTLARLGGDEFGVLMEHCSLDAAHRVATSLQKAIQDYQFSWEGRSFKIGVSMGLVPITETAPNLTELQKNADAACYMAKDQGRNRIHVYHPEDSEIAQRHGEMQWVTRLNQALEENRFCLYAQSIVPLNASTEKHYELLIRMIDEKGGIISPAVFLPAAEHYNFISKIDRWVVENAFGLLKDNPAFLKQISFCSINLSGQSITENDFLDFIIKQLDESGVGGEKICFEITETAAISNLSLAVKFITTLKELGCRFALDDFGSGLSSFAYLKNLPVDYLKIDGMFVKDIVDDPIDRAMVKSINEIGHVMGMQTIAEFVENDIVKGILNEIGVNNAQGYGIDKPRPFDELLGRSNNVTDINNPKGNRYEL
jgi:diguanylate cyclase (GGDEF)-like protein/PAS domain S-box-containing protein